MLKKNLFVHLVLFTLVFSGLANKCLADAAAQLQQAAEYKDNGYYNQAEETYKKIVSENPGTDNALKAQKELVFLYLDKKYNVQNTTEDQTAVSKLIADFAKNKNTQLPAVLNKIADQYGKERKYERAKNLYQKIITDFPNSPYAAKSRLDIPKTDIMELVISKRETAAKAAIEKLIADYSDSPYIAETLHDIAYQWRWSKNFAEAIKTYQYVVDHWPNDEYGMWSQMGVAKSNVEVGNFDAAKPALDKLIQNYSKHPSLAEALERIAIQYRKANKFAEAKALYQKIVQIDPNNIFGNRGKVKTTEMDILPAIVAGNDTAAGTAIDNLLTNFATNTAVPAAMTDIAWEYEKVGKYQRAKTVYQKIIDRYPNNFRAGKALIEISKGQIMEFINAGQDDKASAEIDKLVVTYPNHSFLPDALCQIANDYYKKASQLEGGQRQDYFRKAAGMYDKVVNVLPASRNVVPEACYYEGDCYYRLGEYAKAIQCYQKIVDSYPTYSMTRSALFNIGRSYQRMGRAGLISKSDADAKTKSAYEQLVARYPDCKFSATAQKWLSQQTTK
jgi:tetratricopeptide (TPR) repeat protein